MTIPVSHGKPDAGNLHVRFEEGAGVPCGGAPLYSTKVVDVPSDPAVMRRVWRAAKGKGFARRRIHDLRLAETLRYWEVDTFYTRNVRDFEGVGFKRLANPFE